ncbi:MAG TPA: tRNA (adenosine(37)-N6)-dimethylallyltransferase MiaA [Ignavibacteria bacterium]|nr:tRNA (adenosine(37)-N6)-dimethylallyltransferase MiaA [Ignavibacteria bacterium]
MNENKFLNKAIIISGPTASGKTAVSVELALRIDAEIISADSKQVFKGFPIASAVPTKEEMKGVVHHFIEMLEPDENYTAGIFGVKGREKIKEIFGRNKNVIVSGGSGLYINALMGGLFEDDVRNEEIRNNLKNILKYEGKEYLYNELMKVDRESAMKTTPDFSRRIIRALEVYYTSGRKMSDLQKELPDVDINFQVFGLLLDREYLYERINQRTDNMLKAGLVDEVKSLIEKGYDYRKNNSLNSVGIKEVFGYLEGEYDYERMVELIKQNTRRYGKKQMTWYRKVKGLEWIKVERGDSIEKVVDRIYERI